jgi:hypothetical protein
MHPRGVRKIGGSERGSIHARYYLRCPLRRRCRAQDEEEKCLMPSDRSTENLFYLVILMPATRKPIGFWVYGISYAAYSGKIPVFDCAVALCTMQNALLVISNLAWLEWALSSLQSNIKDFFHFYSAWGNINDVASRTKCYSHNSPQFLQNSFHRKAWRKIGSSRPGLSFQV